MGRIGGDEFVLLLSNIDSVASAWYTCEKIRKVLSQAVQLDTFVLYPTASIGVAVFPDNGQSETELLEAADQSMYQAKKAGRNIVKPSLKT